MERARRHADLLAESDEIKREYLSTMTDEYKLSSFRSPSPMRSRTSPACARAPCARANPTSSTARRGFITDGGYADGFTVFAKTDPVVGNRGISAFVVPKDDTVTVDKKEDKMGQRASNTATITFNDTVIPAKNLLGAEHQGFNIAMATLDNTRPGTAAMAVGIARAVFEHRRAPKERVQFRRPIAMHQAIQFQHRRHGDGDRGVAAADLAVGGAARPGAAQHAAVLARAALRVQTRR